MNLQELGPSSDSSDDEEEPERVTPSSPKISVDGGGGGNRIDSKGSEVVGLENVAEPGTEATEVSGGSSG